MSEVKVSEVERQQLIAKVKGMIEEQVGMTLVEMTKIEGLSWTPYSLMSPTGKIIFTVGIGVNESDDLYMYLERQGQYVWGGCYEWLEDVCHEIKKINRERWRRRQGHPQPVSGETDA